MRRTSFAAGTLAAVAAVVLVSPHQSRAYDELGPPPTAAYASLEAARDSIGVMVGHAVREIMPPSRRRLSGAGGAAPDTMIQVSRSPAKFKYWYANQTGLGWSYRIVVRDSSECPMMKLEYALDAAGWSPDHGYAADGPDGSIMGFVSKDYFCMLESRWDAGDESDDVALIPGCELTVTCVPRRPDDVPR